jgi:hypothetical protein
MNPIDSVIAKIRISYSDSYIKGFKCFTKEGLCVLEAGSFGHKNDKDIILEEGERFLGVRSTRHINDDTHIYGANHTSMTLIFGKLE